MYLHEQIKNFFVGGAVNIFRNNLKYYMNGFLSEIRDTC